MPFQAQSLAGVVVIAFEIDIQRRDDLEHQVSLQTAVDGMAITETAQGVILAVYRITVQPAIAEDLLEDQLGKLTVLLGRLDLGVLDLLLYLFFFVGQEHVLIAIAGDQQLILQAIEARFDLAAQRHLVGINLLDGKRDQVVESGLDQINITDQEQGFENVNVVRIQNFLLGGLFENPFDVGIEERLDCRVKRMEWHQDAQGLVDILPGGILEGIQQ